MWKNFLPIWLVLLSAIALWWPDITTKFDPFLDPKSHFPILLDVLFASAMFAIGTLLPREEIDRLMARWPTVFLGASTQYLVMPLLAFGLASLPGLSVEAKIGIILAGSVPGAMASNILTMQARGNVSYSVSLTTTTTILSPLIVPAILSFSLSSLISTQELDLKAQFDPQKLGVNLMLTVAGPVILGHLCSRYSSRVQNTSRAVSELIANLLILWIIAVVVAIFREQFLLEPIVILVLLVLNLVGYTSGYGVGKLFKLDEGMKRALTMEVGMQNAGLGAVLASKLFADRPAVAIPTVLYMFGCMLSGTILAGIWRARTTENSDLNLNSTIVDEQS